MSLCLGSVPTVIVSSAEMAQQFLKTYHHVFSSRPTISSSKIMVYDAIDVLFYHYRYNWRQLRRICVTKSLSPKRLEFFCFQREEEVSVMVYFLLEECARISDPVVDVSKIIPNVAVNIMCQMVFGRKYSDEETYDTGGFKEMIQEFAFMLGVFDIGDFIPYLGWMDLQGLHRRHKAIHKKADAFYEKLIEEHLAQKDTRETRDFVDVLLALSENNNASEVNVRKDNIKAILIVS